MLSHTGKAKKNTFPKKREASGEPTLAALDLGTNNCRLLIAKPHRPGRKAHVSGRAYYGDAGMPFQVTDAFSRIVRLGEGLTHTGRLSDMAIERSLTALTICAAKMRRRQVTHARCIATEACRQAINGRDFLAKVYMETGLTLEIISGQEEAALGLMGCLPLLNKRQKHALIFDIGGGSTEVSWLALDANGVFQPASSLSLPVGVVTLAEHFSQQGPIANLHQQDFTLENYRQIKQEITPYLQSFDQQHQISAHVKARDVQMIGTSGTVTTLAGLKLRLRRYERSQVDGMHLNLIDTQKIIDRLKASSPAERAAMPCIGPRRADLVLPGCAILEAMLNLWPIDQIGVADRGLREGLLCDLTLNLANPERTDKEHGKKKSA